MILTDKIRRSYGQMSQGPVVGVRPYVDRLNRAQTRPHFMTVSGANKVRGETLDSLSRLRCALAIRASLRERTPMAVLVANCCKAVRGDAGPERILTADGTGRIRCCKGLPSPQA
jgi:hypothetical protein